MSKNKRRIWGLGIILTLALLIVGTCVVDETDTEVVVSNEGIEDEYVIVGGIPIGIYLDTDGVMVIDTDEIADSYGNIVNPSDNLITSGDYIIGINEVTVETKNELVEQVSQLDGSAVVLEVRRDLELIEVSVTPTLDENGEYKLGIWVRDNLQGLGTLTYIDTQSGFGALGHGINDIDTGELLEISEGELYKASISGIIKGESGSPGGLEGVIIYNSFNIIGQITMNSTAGIYGTIENLEELDGELELMEVASVDEIEMGPATIRCTIDDEVCEYEIEIVEVNVNETEVNKGLVIEITDEELIEQTGGIVQGMSGAPIVQNGKLIGAVTHVFVNDPTRGYGIFIESMLETAEGIE